VTLVGEGARGSSIGHANFRSGRGRPYPEFADDVSLSDVVIPEETDPPSGGGLAVINVNAITVSDVVFQDCSSELCGGALFCLKAEFKLSRCHFIKNVSKTGGSLFLLTSEAVVSDSEFSENQSDRGGAFFADGVSQLELLRCKFLSNTSNVEGACGTVKGNSKAKVQDTDFSQNSAPNAGCLFFLESTVSLDVCTFSDNKAHSEDGGAFFAQNSEIMFKECQFEANEAQRDGGAIYGRTLKKLELVECTVRENKALSGRGGAFSAHDSELIFKTCQFDANEAKTNGGAIFGRSLKRLELSGGTFTKNSAMLGGACCIRAHSKSVEIVGVDFKGNWATGVFNDKKTGVMIHSGGAVWSGTTENVKLTRCVFEKNNSPMFGGGLVAYRGSKVELDDCTFRENFSGIGGGGYIDSSEIEILDCHFEGNRTMNVDGGALGLFNCSGKILGSEFSGNSSSGGGGAIEFRTVNHTRELLVEESTFEGNKSKVDGGGLDIKVFGRSELKARIINTDFRNNEARTSGGGACIGISGRDRRSSNLDLEISGGIFMKNRAGTGGKFPGGGVVISGPSITDQENKTRVHLEDVEFSNNESSLFGGGVYMQSIANPMICKNLVIGSNTSGGGGGVILFDVRATFIGCKITENTARDAENGGGGILWSKYKPVLKEGTRVEGNTPDDVREWKTKKKDDNK
ncbi:MAG: hypothetical protein ACYS47_07390, partial [Planctomycetota bacterium]|jgi:predicted outer membrane repeat protein